MRYLLYFVACLSIGTACSFGRFICTRFFFFLHFYKLLLLEYTSINGYTSKSIIFLSLQLILLNKFQMTLYVFRFRVIVIYLFYTFYYGLNEILFYPISITVSAFNKKIRKREFYSLII